VGQTLSPNSGDVML